ncbi:MAG: hypothetical protein F4003_04535 [Acidimicrobiaceae bacterium]|nr:hypothetical protein [Acidimicrobiaceae bacterium]MYC41692.1 hypothetical protein [Acidimicrobiaceae bacterium]
MSTVNLGSVSVNVGPPAYDGAQCDMRGCTSKADMQLVFRARRKHTCEKHKEGMCHELVRPEAEKRAAQYATKAVEKMLDKTFGRSRTINVKF